MSNAQRFDTLYGETKKFLKDTLGGKLDASTVTTLIRFAMESVQNLQEFRGMKGSEKKQLVIAVITEVVKDALTDTSLSPETQQLIMSSLSFAPFVIDMAVDFAKAYVKIPTGNSGCCKFLRCGK